MRSRENYYNDVFDIRQDLNQFFNRWYNFGLPREQNDVLAGFSPEVQWYIDQDGKRFHCKISLPGVEAKNEYPGAGRQPDYESVRRKRKPRKSD